MTNQVFLGCGKFINNVRKYIPYDKDLSEIPMSQKRPLAKSLSVLYGHSRDRDEAIMCAFESGGYRMKLIGGHFGPHYSRNGRIVNGKGEKARGMTQ